MKQVQTHKTVTTNTQNWI